MITKKDLLLFNEAYRILIHGDDFVYLLPHLGLRSFVSNYTITFPNKSIISDQYTIIPHGSGTLVFSCDKEGIHSRLFGPATKTNVVGGHANLSDLLFIVEFHPAGLSALTGMNQKDLTDQIIPFELISPVLNQLISDALEAAKSIHESILTLDQLLLENIRSSIPSELSFSLQRIIKNAGNISTKELSSSAFYSERHLNRIFNQYIGMSTKSFSRLVRINKAVRLLQNPETSITSACLLAGFYDLSHFVHDFKSVCGITPKEYQAGMSDYYNEIAKF